MCDGDVVDSDVNTIVNEEHQHQIHCHCALLIQRIHNLSCHWMYSALYHQRSAGRSSLNERVKKGCGRREEVQSHIPATFYCPRE